MIAKYKKLTEDLEGKKEELIQQELEDIERMENIIKEEEELELDADKVVNYLINLIAFLNEEDDGDGKDGKKMSKLGSRSVKDLLKTRFQNAGFNKETLGPSNYDYSDRPARSRRQNYKQGSRKISGNISVASEATPKDENNENAAHVSKKSGFANPDTVTSKDQETVSLKMDTTPQEKFKNMPQNMNYEVDFRKLKIEDLEDETAEMILKALDDVKEIKETIIIEKSMIEEALNHMKSDFGKEKQVLNAKFESTKVYLQKYVENIQKDLEEELIKRNREKANFNLKINNLDSKVEKLKKSFNNQDDATDSLAETVNLLVETEMISHAMQVQDEIDREKLALMGYKEENVDLKAQTMKTRGRNTESNNPYVSLDKQCLTCSGQSSVVMKAFKIACLAYKPSPVVFPETEMKSHLRIDLLNLKGKMLKNLEKIPLTRIMREEGRDPINERIKLFNQYMHFSMSKAQQKDSMINSLFHTRQPKITIRSEAMSSTDIAHPGSPHDMQNDMEGNFDSQALLSRNINMLSNKTEALSKNPFKDMGVKKVKKRGSSKDFFGGQTMSLPKIKTARAIKPSTLNQ